MKKVLIILPGGGGGAERMSITIGKILHKSEFYVKFVVIGTKRSIYDFMPEWADVECIPVRNKFCFSTLRIYNKIKKEKPTIVFASQSSYNPRVIIASCIAKAPVIVRSSGMVGNYHGLKFLSVKATYRFADMLIAQQEEMKEEIVNRLKVKRDKVLVLHNPLDIETIDRLVQVESPFKEGGSVNYVNVARVSPAKGQDIAIKALFHVKKEIPSANLYFVGEYNINDDFFKSLGKLVEKYNLQDSVHFVGFDSNPYRWMKYCSCFILPSRREGLPNALIEASYIGCPCVASRCLDIIPSIIRNGCNGYLAKVEDEMDLARTMVDCINLRDFSMIYKPSAERELTGIFNCCADSLHNSCV